VLSTDWEARRERGDDGKLYGLMVDGSAFPNNWDVCAGGGERARPVQGLSLSMRTVSAHESSMAPRVGEVEMCRRLDGPGHGVYIRELPDDGRLPTKPLIARRGRRRRHDNLAHVQAI
jgi:hypothetical protein